MKQSETFYPLGERLKDVEDSMKEILKLLQRNDLTAQERDTLLKANVRASVTYNETMYQIKCLMANFSDN